MEPSASQVFCGRVLGMVNAEDVNAIILAQKNMLDRFEKTNEMLLNFNNLSSVRMQQMSERFLHHTRTLVEMKKDLDSIFRRIRWGPGGNGLAPGRPPGTGAVPGPGSLCRGAAPRLCQPFLPAGSHPRMLSVPEVPDLSPDVPHIPPGTGWAGAAGRAGTPGQPAGSQGLSPQP
uniref:KxDL motif-containing protein 1 n=1 Tax=Junco hyemalis TaxID=40217 RepID=A0A8C5IUQ3_JUNHY